jgi:LmbE family N-acetylglucosaminyl deacetylase
MLALAEPELIRRLRTVLLLGAHADDIEIGCGGTVARLLELNADLQVEWVVFTSDPRREAEARAAASSLLGERADTSVTVHTFETSYLPQAWRAVKDEFERLKERLPAPDVIFTHWTQDSHQDHRTVGELTWNTYRSHFILEYEVLKYDGDLGRPNVFVALEREHLDRKLASLSHFVSQGDKHWFDTTTFEALARIRGVESVSPSGYAEAFHCRKLRLL